MTGVLSAKSEGDARRELSQQSLSLIEVHRVGHAGEEGAVSSGPAASSSSRGSWLRARLRRSVTGGAPRIDMGAFTRQLSTLISSGIPLVESLDLVALQVENAAWQEMLRNLARQIRAGQDFSTALRSYPGVFPPLFVNMVRAGEVSGSLDEVLNRLAEHLESVTEMRRQVKSALAYPLLSLSLGLAVAGFLLAGVLPKFEPIFLDMQIELPWLTRGALAAGKAAQAGWIWVVGSLPLLGFALGAMRRSPSGARRLSRFVFRIPLVGALVRKAVVARFARTLGTLLQSGVPILASLELVADAVGNAELQPILLAARDEVRRGQGLAATLGRHPIFPAAVVRMIHVGEQSGALESMLGRVATAYESEVRASSKTLVSFLEPLLIAFLGLFTATLVLAVFLPIFRLQASLGGS